eukprot:COSAG06_NODE_16296_length_1008_cov_1.814081_2_plen_128_part_01
MGVPPRLLWLLPLLREAECVPRAAAAPRYLYVPGSSGALIDALRGGTSEAFPPPSHREDRGHVGTWGSDAPELFRSAGGEKVIPQFIADETMRAAQQTLRLAQGRPPLGDVSEALRIPGDYAFYDQAS